LFEDHHEAKQYATVERRRWSGWSFVESNKRKLCDIVEKD